MEKYKIKKMIGEGSFAKVERAWVDGEGVAVKRLYGRESDAERVLDMPEVKALQILNHPNIITLK